jgi:hypothetical protein
VTLLLLILKPLLLKYGASMVVFLVGWFRPSPIKKAANEQAQIHNAESKAQSSGGNVSGLDNLP